MIRHLFLGFIVVLAFACKQPTTKKDKKNKPDATSTSQSNPADPSQASASSPSPAEPGEPTSQGGDDLKLTVAASAPKKEIPPIVPMKSDPDCEAPEVTLSNEDKVALLKTYIEIHKDFLTREKGVKNIKDIPDPADPLRFEISFQDLFGNPAKMDYKFGKAVAAGESFTLCLDEGNNVLLWAGTYKRDPAKKFVKE